MIFARCAKKRTFIMNMSSTRFQSQFKDAPIGQALNQWMLMHGDIGVIIGDNI